MDSWPGVIEQEELGTLMFVCLLHKWVHPVAIGAC